LVAAVCSSVAFMGCGDDDDSANNAGGSAGLGTGGSSAGSGGHATGGSSAGNTTAGNPTGGTSAGSGGKGGATTGGVSGSGGTAGGGTAGGGTAGGGTAGTNPVGGAPEGGAGGAGPVDCVEDPIGGASSVDEGGAAGAGGAGPEATTAVVLVDNIVVKNGATTYKSWLFADATAILDEVVGDVGDKWVRPPFDTNPDNLAQSSAFAHDVFSKCSGKPAGSLKNVIPFVKPAQYYKVTIGFDNKVNNVAVDWGSFVISADVKLVSGGNAAGACAANAALFVQDGSGANAGAAVQLNPGEWKTATLTVPAATNVDHISLNISDYTCL
jgi:hypothetical protein